MPLTFGVCSAFCRRRGLKTPARRGSGATPVARTDCPLFSALQDTTCEGAVPRPSSVQSGHPHSTTSKAPRRQDNGALRTFHPDGKHRWQLRQTRVARSAGAHLLLLSPRRSNRSAHHSSQSVRFLKNRISCCNPDRWIAAPTVQRSNYWPEVQLKILRAKVTIYTALQH